METRQVNGLTIGRYQIIGTHIMVYCALEPAQWDDHGSTHSSMIYRDKQLYGQIGSRHLPPDLDALPAWTDERITAVSAWHAELYRQAHDAIIAAFPQAASGKRVMDEITTYGEVQP